MHETSLNDIIIQLAMSDSPSNALTVVSTNKLQSEYAVVQPEAQPEEATSPEAGSSEHNDESYNSIQPAAPRSNPDDAILLTGAADANGDMAGAAVDDDDDDEVRQSPPPPQPAMVDVQQQQQQHRPSDAADDEDDTTNAADASQQQILSNTTAAITEDTAISFPQRLMEILDDESNADIIGWLPHGRAFCIYRKHEFESSVLPRYFHKQSKYSSFTRKLNRWGFVRVTRGPETGAYYHRAFKRGEHRLCTQMSCHSIGGSSNSSHSKQRNGPNAEDDMINDSMGGMMMGGSMHNADAPLLAPHPLYPSSSHHPGGGSHIDHHHYGGGGGMYPPPYPHHHPSPPPPSYMSSNNASSMHHHHHPNNSNMYNYPPQEYGYPQPPMSDLHVPPHYPPYMSSQNDLLPPSSSMYHHRSHPHSEYGPPPNYPGMHYGGDDNDEEPPSQDVMSTMMMRNSAAANDVPSSVGPPPPTTATGAFQHPESLISMSVSSHLREQGVSGMMMMGSHHPPHHMNNNNPDMQMSSSESSSYAPPLYPYHPSSYAVHPMRSRGEEKGSGIHRYDDPLTYPSNSSDS